MATERTFTPALGYEKLTPLYDRAVALFTREDVWRKWLITQIALTSRDRILDVGCGTGSLAILLKKSAANATVIGIDPDEVVLSLGRDKANTQNVTIEWYCGFLSYEIAEQLRPINKIVSSLVFHQTPLKEKQRLLNVMHDLVEPGGYLYIVDYGLQRSRVMRLLFRLTVQIIDGIEDTQPNADGVLPILMKSAGFADVSEVEVIPTVTGSISFYRAQRV